MKSETEIEGDRSGAAIPHGNGHGGDSQNGMDGVPEDTQSVMASETQVPVMHEGDSDKKSEMDLDDIKSERAEAAGGAGGADVKDLFSGSTPPPQHPQSPYRESRSGSRSRSQSPRLDEDGRVKEEKTKKGKSATPPARAGPIIIDDLPTAWDEAHETFTALDKCVYERKDLGLSRESDEMMVCDCVYDKRDSSAQACMGDDECINRALFIECLAAECRAKGQCRNQRFTKKEYAPIEIVLTEMKGYGLRAKEHIPSGSLIYEYIGEVVKEVTFRKRMQQYADEGIRHFYFMMLQKEEYIDATKKGGIGRFANHSCDPNSEVQKWVVGRRLRMGIFSKRDIVKGEEVTFNYNVDRYGHDAQICYCGEPNCVGFIGGKTQTNSSLGTMNDLFLDALGITDEVEALQLKGNKKKKSKQLDEDFVPTLRPITELEAQKVAAAMRQSVENPKMMTRLLERIKMTDDMTIHRQLMRLHGFGLMRTILTQLADERAVVQLALESMQRWKTTIRTKIEDSGIEEPVKELKDGPDDDLKRIAEELLTYWSTLESPYRIAKKAKIASLDEEDDAETTTIAENNTATGTVYRPSSAWDEASQPTIFTPLRPRFASAPRPRPSLPPPPVRQPSQPTNAAAAAANRSALDAIIAQAQQAAQAQAAAAAAAAAVESPAESSRSGSRAVEADDERRHKRQKRAPEEVERKKEKELKRLVGEVVVKSMTKYKEQMEHDTFKRYARECTELLVDKEKKGHSYTSHRHPSLNDEKRAKMKAFTKEFVHKVLKRLKEKGKLRKHRGEANGGGSGSGTMSTPGATPATTEGSSVILGTPNGRDGDGEGDDGEGNLVDDLFGAAEERDDDMDMDMDVDMDGGGESEATRTPMEKKAPVRIDPTPTPSASIKMANRTAAATPPIDAEVVDMTMVPSSSPGFERETWLGRNGNGAGAVKTNGVSNGNGADRTDHYSPKPQSTSPPVSAETKMAFGGIGVGAIKVDSFRPTQK